jgi:hypothetical protein
MTENREDLGSRALLTRALVAALITAALSFALTALLQAIGIHDSATVITVLLVPVLVFSVVAGRLKGFTAPGVSLSFFEEVKEVKELTMQNKARLDSQQKQIDLLTIYSISPSLLRHLAGVALLNNYEYREGIDSGGKDVGPLFKREFYYLKDRGFIGPPTLEFDWRLNGHNIGVKAQPTDRAELTELGWTYLSMHRDDILKDEKCKKWFDPKNPEIRDNLNIEAVRAIGLEVSGEGENRMISTS